MATARGLLLWAGMLRGIVFTILAAAVACSVTAYDPTGSQQGQQQQSGGASSGTQAPTPSPPSTPPSQPAPDPGYADIAMPKAPADMATPSTAPNCATLSQCCQQLQDPDQQQQCMDAVTGLDDKVCAFILQQLEDGGYCP